MKNWAKIALLFSPMLVLLLIDCSNTIHWFSLMNQSSQNSNLEKKYNPRKEDAIIFKVKDLNNSSKIKWKNHSEFIYNNIFYDVVAIDKIDSGYLIYCTDDDKETEISLKIKELDKRKEKENKYFHFSKKTIYSKIIIPKIKTTLSILEILLKQLQPSFYNSIFKNIDSPPPQNI